MSLIDGLRHVIVRAKHGGSDRCDGCVDAKRLLAAIEGAEVMWRVRYAGGGPFSMHSHQENAMFRAATDEKYGHHDAIIERVIVIREEA